jgi:hypothetical protein
MFGSQYCTTQYHNAAVTVQAVVEKPAEPVYTVKDIWQPQLSPPRLF